MSIMIDDVLILPKAEVKETLSVGDEKEHYGLQDNRNEHNRITRDVIFKVVAVNEDHYEVKILDILTP
ncbi:hypothetical protein B0H98_102205 [Vreelandella songnenensis]|uniref:Uncharacterized protein n=1 Tax=Vreelandella songnenensis TaxID=1176243 RepID=A0A2T0V6E4_9GAMM|nr:hypothetical protein [Halomonas songnenensis]PRY65677.1 hypothetical protein B0H98_102205 [Halomonas songnenensis]